MQSLAEDGGLSEEDLAEEAPPQWASMDFRDTGLSASDASLADERMSTFADHTELAKRETGNESDLRHSMDSIGSSI